MNLFDFLAPPPPPWQALPHSFGYVAGSHPVVCTRAELERVCEEQTIPREVWTPESHGLVPPEEVPFLLAAIRRRLLRRPLRGALLVAAIGSLVVSTEARRSGMALGSPAALYALMVGALLVLLLHSAWRAARLTPGGFRALLREASVAQGLRRHPVVHTPWLAAMMAAGGVAQLTAMVLLGWPGQVAESLAGATDYGLFPAAVWAEAVLLDGEWWRLLTAAFVHGGFLHFGVNLMALLMLGRATEMFAGRGMLPLVFLLSILGGSTLGVLLPPHAASVGNSGGLVGLVAFLGVLAWRRPAQVPPGFLNAILVNVALLVGIGLVGYAYVDNAAHAGGALTGALVGLALIPGAGGVAYWQAGRGVRRAGGAALGVLAVASLWTVLVVVAQAV